MTNCHQNPDAIGRKGRLDRITADQNRFLQAVTNPRAGGRPCRRSRGAWAPAALTAHPPEMQFLRVSVAQNWALVHDYLGTYWRTESHPCPVDINCQLVSALGISTRIRANAWIDATSDGVSRKGPGPVVPPSPEPRPRRRMLTAALWAVAPCNPQLPHRKTGESCGALATVPQREQVRLVNAGSTSTNCLPAHSALYASC